MRTLLRVVVSVTMLALAACSTVAGAGRDITDTARWVKEKL
jgi:predicted small secreted protein